MATLLGYATHKSAHIFISELSVTLGKLVFSELKKNQASYFQYSNLNVITFLLLQKKKSLKWWIKYSFINMHL